MGKQWLLYRFTSDGAGAGGCHGTGKSPSSTGKSTKAAGKYSRKASNQIPTSSSSSGGCMSAIFHMFDIQHLPFHQPSFISDSFVNIPQESNLILQGVEAPRNSLELDEELVASSSSSSSSKPKQDTNLNLPMAGIQIKTKRSRFLMMDDVSSESSTTSPATKTPNVVARLMGLDLLPENSSPRTSSSSPRPSSSSSYQTPLNPLSKLSSRNHQTTHSLPVTPRMSTADHHHHHRLSLQMNKENSDYAKEIAKQVRENISRRVGGDITNTMKKKEEVRRDQCLVVLKPKRRSVLPPAVQAVTQTAVLKEKENEPGSFSNSCSPRVRLLEIKNSNFKKPTPNPPFSTTPIEPTKPPSSSSNIKISTPPLMMEDLEKVEMVKTLKKVKIGSEKYDLRLKKMHQEEEAFVKECKKKKEKKKSTPLSNGLVVNVKTRRSSKFISFKKEKEMASSSPSSTTPTLSQKQVPLDSIQQLPRCQSHHQSHITKHHNYPNGNAVPTAAVTGAPVAAAGDDQYFDYISRIFTHIGIDKNTPISIAHWYSPSHPLHPSIFHHLEQELLPPTTAGDHLHRKLIFEAVDEVLVEILKPYIGFKPWAGSGWSSRRMYGWELVEIVRRKIWSFPAADCRVLEDIDGLIAGDLRGSTRVVGTTAFEEVAEEIVKEMEREMVEMLVEEVAAMAVVRWWSDGGHVHGHGGFT
ncbi:hypothetical protein OSB04_026196 [Centaurea solstitialis]|uniref:DUF4378 domain-containing protein n=1 Tax=Centaurea solstitialis TaxID=347529 RepID=A0AA38W5P4_9ASTR|nr:hypothetical protein OSB04_026196 [Centaurea solstitialis]